MTVPGKPSTLIKPKLDTKFHIDYSWWERHESDDLRSYLLTHLMPEQREYINQLDQEQRVDYIDPDTGEVTQLDQLQLYIREAAQEPDFINPHTSLVDSVFRVFLANGNVPQSPRQLAEQTGRDAGIILRTLGGPRIYKGIRPKLD